MVAYLMEDGVAMVRFKTFDPLHKNRDSMTASSLPSTSSHAPATRL